MTISISVQDRYFCLNRKLESPTVSTKTNAPAHAPPANLNKVFFSPAYIGKVEPLVPLGLFGLFALEVIKHTLNIVEVLVPPVQIRSTQMLQGVSCVEQSLLYHTRVTSVLLLAHYRPWI